MRRRLRVILLVLLAAAVAAWLALRFMRPPEVELAAATRGPAVDAVYATGTVEPTLEIRIAPRAAGRIVELLADEGDAVRRGQLLARLEDEDLRAQVTELEARAEYAKNQYERNLELRRAALIPQEGLDRAKTDYDAARAALKRAREQVGYMRLTAPADGQIIRRDGEVGEFVPVNQTIFYMAGEAPLRIAAEVDEEDVPRVVPGQQVLIRSDAFPGQLFEGRVDQVTPRGDPTARSYRVRIALVGDPPLKVGMTAETNIVLERREEALLVPTNAVEDGKVWVLEGDRARLRAATIGVVGPERTEIRAGLDEGARLIVGRPEGLEAGSRVRVRRPAGLEAAADAR